jgi:hypothetical protein
VDSIEEDDTGAGAKARKPVDLVNDDNIDLNGGGAH